MPDTTRPIRHGEVTLQTQAFGDPSDPFVLMIMGASASMLWWPEAMCDAIAATGRFVIH